MFYIFTKYIYINRLPLCTNLKKSDAKNYLISFKPIHKVSTQFSEANFKYKKLSLTRTKYSISVRGQKVPNAFLTKEEKVIKKKN